MADILYKIYIYLKPITYEKIVYRSFTAAEKACRAGGEIEEWCATEGRDRMIFTRMWRRYGTGQLEETVMEVNN
jgi:hypothetical protein